MPPHPVAAAPAFRSENSPNPTLQSLRFGRATIGTLLGGTNEAISRRPRMFRRAFGPLPTLVAFSAGDGDGAAAGDSNRTRHGECDARFWSRNRRSRFSPPRRAEYLLAGFG